MNIGVIGCGWLGKDLAFELSKKHKVECYKRDKTTDDSEFWQNDIIIICINTKKNYLKTLKKISILSKSSSSIILMSSTSVYREFDKEVDEETLITKKGLQKEAEELVSSLKERVLILRLGGLMGVDRISGKWKSSSGFSDGPVNYIHKDDVIAIVKQMIEANIDTGIYNLVAPEHPMRSEVHTKNCKKFGFERGTFNTKTDRVVKSKALAKKLNYRFLHPNPLNFWD